MNSLASDQTVTAIQHSELISSVWDLGRISRDQVLKAASSEGFNLLTNHGQRIKPDQWIESGKYSLSSERQTQELAFVKKLSVHAQSCFLNEDNYLLFIDSRGTAYTNLGLDATVAFDGALEALRMDSVETLLLAWVWLNAQALSPWQEILDATSRSQILDTSRHSGALVPDLPEFSEHLLAELTALAQLVNSDLILEENEKSTHRFMKFKPGTAWHLRDYSRAANSDSKNLLSSKVSSVLVGTSAKSEAKAGLPSTGEKWLLTGRVNSFQDQNGKPVIVSPGNVVTPSIGTTSRARIADQEMALARGHYALIPNADVNPEEVADFLNSRHAQRQRSEAAQSGIIPRLSKKDLLNFEFFESTNVRSQLDKLALGWLDN